MKFDRYSDYLFRERFSFFVYNNEITEDIFEEVQRRLSIKSENHMRIRNCKLFNKTKGANEISLTCSFVLIKGILWVIYKFLKILQQSY